MIENYKISLNTMLIIITEFSYYYFQSQIKFPFSAASCFPLLINEFNDQGL